MAYEVEASHPFIHRELIFPSVVVQMLNEARRQLSNARRRLGACRVDDSLSEMRIEFV